MDQYRTGEILKPRNMNKLDRLKSDMRHMREKSLRHPPKFVKINTTNSATSLRAIMDLRWFPSACANPFRMGEAHWLREDGRTFVNFRYSDEYLNQFEEVVT